MEKNPTTMDSPSSEDKRRRKNIAIGLQRLGFEDTPESRKVDPWMTRVLARAEQQQPVDDCATKHSVPEKKDDHKQSAPVLDEINKHPNANADIQSPKNRKGKGKEKEKETGPIDDDHDILQDSSRTSPSFEIVAGLAVPVEKIPANKIMVEMGGCGLVFVILKKLMMADVSPQQNCLSIPKRQLENQFLEEEEVKWLSKRGVHKVKLLILNRDDQPVGVDKSDFKTFSLTTLEHNVNVYALKGRDWYSLVQQHQLKQHMLVQLWAFRVESMQLHFVLVKLHDDPPIQ